MRRISYIGLKWTNGRTDYKEAMKKLAIPLTMCLLAGAACWPFDGEEELAAMSLRSQGGGKVQILRQGESAITVKEDDVAVRPGDVIRTYDGGLAQVALEGERVAWVGGREQPSAGVPEAQMQILSTKSVETETGTVMAEASDPMEVHFGDVVASGSDGVFRVDRRAGAARAASYKGEVRVTAPGEADVVLDRLFESPAIASDIRPAQPYRLDAADPFDGRQLEDVIELENTLGAIEQGLVTQLGRQKPSLSYFRAFADGRNVDPLKKHLRRPAKDLLLGFTIAINTKSENFRTALESTFQNRDDGGSWGVVAEIVGSDPKLLLADLNNIIDASRIVAGGNQAPVFDAAAAQDASSGNVAPPPDDGGGGGNDPDPDPDPNPGDPGGGGGEEPEEPEDCDNVAECAANDIGDELPGGGGDPDPEPSPSNILDGVTP
jgi:hypothetical protein